MPAEHRRAAVKCDRTWNGALPGSVGAFEGLSMSTLLITSPADLPERDNKEVLIVKKGVETNGAGVL